MEVKKNNLKIKKIVLKPILDKEASRILINKKKANYFREFLRKPSPTQVCLTDFNLWYYPFLKIKGQYFAEYFRKAVHSLKVEKTVTKVLVGNNTFDLKTKKKFIEKIPGKRGKNIIDIDLEEFVNLNEKIEVILDENGDMVKEKTLGDLKTQENYPTKILREFPFKKIQITNDDAIDFIEKNCIKKIKDQKIRDLKEILQIDEITEIFVPIYEAKLVGPKNKSKLLLVNTIKKQIQT